MTGAVPRDPDLVRFDALFAAHQRLVYAYALRRTASVADAEDVVAETFTIAWRRLVTMPEHPTPWLYAIARRVLANQRRGNGRRERLLSRLRVPDVATPIPTGNDDGGPAVIVLASLSPADQEVLRLIAWEGLRHHEIAEVLGITSNAVAIRLHRARARFAAALQAHDAGSGLKYPARTRTSDEVKGTQGAGLEGVAE